MIDKPLSKKKKRRRPRRKAVGTPAELESSFKLIQNIDMVEHAEQWKVPHVVERQFKIMFDESGYDEKFMLNLKDFFLEGFLLGYKSATKRNQRNDDQ